MKGKKKTGLLIFGLCLIAGIMVSVVCLQRAKTKAEAAAGNAISADITVVKYRTVAGIMQYRRWNETKGIWMDEEWVDFTETPKPTQSAAPNGTPTPKVYVTPAAMPVLGQQTNEAEKPVEITARRFGNPFYLYVRETFDTDGDGMLSLEEREAVTEIDYVSEKYFTAADLEAEENESLNALVNISVYFPNVEKIRVDFAKSIRISELEHLKYFELRAEEENGKRNPYFASEGVNFIQIVQCPALTEINCRNYLDGELEVHSCENLTTYTEEEGCTASIVFNSGMPKLSAYIMERADGTRQETDISHRETAWVWRRFGGQDGFEIIDRSESLIPTPTRTPAALPEKMPESKVVQADASVDKVPVDAAHFSDSVFRAYLLKTYDADKDGFLSRAEREKLTGLSSSQTKYGKYAKFLKDVAVFDGLEWFPKLESISIESSCPKIFLKNHPAIRSIGGGEGGGQIWAENCDKLERMNFIEFYGATVFVKDCKNFRSFSSYSSEFLGLYFSGTPLLMITEDDDGTVGWGKDYFRLDENAGLRIFGLFTTEDGTPALSTEYRKGRSLDELWGSNPSVTEFVRDLEKMKDMNAACFARAEAERVTVYRDKDEKGKKMKSVYFSHLGDTTVKPNQWNNKPKTVLRMEVESDDVTLVAENFSFEPIVDEVRVENVLLSLKGTSVIFVSSAANVYYTENGEKKHVGKVSAEHYYVRKPDGSLIVYDTAKEALESMDVYDSLAIDEENFGDAAFCAYLKKEFDTDGDGRLSASECNAVCEISFQIEEVKLPEGTKCSGILKGFENFSGLSVVSTNYGRKIIINSYYGYGCLRRVFIAPAKGEPVGELEIQNSSYLEEVILHDFTGEICLDGCRKLQSYIGVNSKPAKETFTNGTPKLALQAGEAENVTVTADTFMDISGYRYTGLREPIYVMREDIPRRPLFFVEKAGTSLSLLHPENKSITWTGVKENYISLENDFPKEYFREDAVNAFYSIEIKEGTDVVKNGQKQQYCCVIFPYAPARSESFPVSREMAQHPEKFYVKTDRIKERLICDYAPNQGVVFLACLENSLYYADEDGEKKIGSFQNVIEQYWGIDANGELHSFANRKEALEELQKQGK